MLAGGSPSVALFIDVCPSGKEINVPSIKGLVCAGRGRGFGCRTRGIFGRVCGRGGRSCTLGSGRSDVCVAAQGICASRQELPARQSKLASNTECKERRSRAHWGTVESYPIRIQNVYWEAGNPNCVPRGAAAQTRISVQCCTSDRCPR